jgi:hypothetical protein
MRAAANLITAKGERWVWLREHMVNKVAAMRGLADSFSGVIIRLAVAGHSCLRRQPFGAGKQDRPAPLGYGSPFGALRSGGR